jgi:dTDP-4-dehydrorhamnose reductase
MRVYITGCKGQLGQALEKALATDYVSGCDLPELDITDPDAIATAVDDFKPDVVIHTAAWTDVDGCARDPDAAYRANALGTRNVALACARSGAAMVYVSTNEVFDGAATEPYREWDPVGPINPYARSKAAGEWFVHHLLTRFFTVRTAWLFSVGGTNFPHRILRMSAAAAADPEGAEPLRVVADEVGNPTYAPDLASAIVEVSTSGAYGVYHLTNSGECSRYDFAREITRLAGRDNVPIQRITLDEFERDSRPPKYAPLANTAAAALGVSLRPWQDALADFVTQRTSDR